MTRLVIVRHGNTFEAGEPPRRIGARTDLPLTATGVAQAEALARHFAANGVSFDRVFCGESMFSRADNASKVALAWLVAMMRRAGYRLLDCQFITDHLISLGAVTVRRAAYLKLLEEAGADGFQASLPQAFAQFVGAGASAAGLAAGAGLAGSAGASVAAVRAGAPDDDARGAGASSPGKLIAQSLTHTS